MLEKYFAKPSTIERIRARWLAPQIEQYVEWMQVNGYADHNVVRRVPYLCQFADFTERRGITNLNAAVSQVEEFASDWVARYRASVVSKPLRPKHLNEIGDPIRQMLRLALEGRIATRRRQKPYPFTAEAPAFLEYLRTERGLRESTVRHYLYSLNRVGDYLKRIGVISLRELSPPLLGSFVVDTAPTLSRSSRRDLCGELRVFLKFCYREQIIAKDLSAAVQMPQIYRLSDVPRSITWDEVRRMLETVDRRTAQGRRDYAILLLLVTYGLRAHEVAKLTLDDIDWRHERLQVPGRKAGGSDQQLCCILVRSVLPTQSWHQSASAGFAHAAAHMCSAADRGGVPTQNHWRLRGSSLSVVDSDLYKSCFGLPQGSGHG